MNDDPDAVTGPPGGPLEISPPEISPPLVSPLAVAALRLRGSVDMAGIAGLALDAVVPALADAAAVFAAEQLLRDGMPGHAGGGRVAVRRLGARFGPDGRQVPSQAFPPGEVIVLPAGSPYVRCMRTGEPVIFTRPDGRTLARAAPAARQALARYASFLAAPMTADGAVAGFLTLARAPGGPAFGAGEAAAAGQLAGHAGTGIANAVALTRHRTIADALQRGLLAADPPQPALLEVAGRCLPAAGQLVGGDWYDIIPLPGGRTGLVVGDVMGHGPEAAAVMAQLRAAAHALAQLDLAPAEVLGQLDRTTAELRGATLATCVYAVIDPGRLSYTIAAAGHLPAVLALPDGTTRVPDLSAGPSLGLRLGASAYGQARVGLPPGAILALYTDGLVETRIQPFDQGILGLRAELAGARGPLDAICDELLRPLADRAEDDITLILARVPPRLAAPGLAPPPLGTAAVRACGRGRSRRRSLAPLVIASPASRQALARDATATW